MLPHPFTSGASFRVSSSFPILQTFSILHISMVSLGMLEGKRICHLFDLHSYFTIFYEEFVSFFLAFPLEVLEYLYSKPKVTSLSLPFFLSLCKMNLNFFFSEFHHKSKKIIIMDKRQQWCFLLICRHVLLLPISISIIIPGCHPCSLGIPKPLPSLFSNNTKEPVVPPPGVYFIPLPVRGACLVSLQKYEKKQPTNKM